MPAVRLTMPGKASYETLKSLTNMVKLSSVPPG